MHHRHRAGKNPGLCPAAQVAWHDVGKGDMQATSRAGRYLNVFAGAAAPRPPPAPLRRRGNCASRGGSARAATIFPATACPTTRPQIPNSESSCADPPVYPQTWGGRASFLGMRSGSDSGSMNQDTSTNVTNARVARKRQTEHHRRASGIALDPHLSGGEFGGGETRLRCRIPLGEPRQPRPRPTPPRASARSLRRGTSGAARNPNALLPEHGARAMDDPVSPRHVSRDTEPRKPASNSPESSWPPPN